MAILVEHPLEVARVQDQHVIDDRGAFRLPESNGSSAAYVEIEEVLLDALLDGVKIVDKPMRDRRSRARLH